MPMMRFRQANCPESNRQMGEFEMKTSFVIDLSYLYNKGILPPAFYAAAIAACAYVGIAVTFLDLFWMFPVEEVCSIKQIGWKQYTECTNEMANDCRVFGRFVLVCVYFVSFSYFYNMSK